MWMECISDRAYANREDLARDVVRVLREEIACLQAAGAALVQLDEPVLSEVVFSGPAYQRSFMCGALSAKSDTPVELAFARDLVNAVTDGFPLERIVLHMCRGNWTADEGKALSGDYRPLVETCPPCASEPCCWNCVRRAPEKWKSSPRCPPTCASASAPATRSMRT